MDGTYKGVDEWEGVGGCRGEWEAEGKLKIPLGLIQQQCVFSKCMTPIVRIHRIGQDSRWVQFGITHIIINAIQAPHRLCSASLLFYRLAKGPP